MDLFITKRPRISGTCSSTPINVTDAEGTSSTSSSASVGASSGLDYSHVLHGKIDDLSQRGEKPKQPCLTFPKSCNRKFSTHWYKEYSWIEYSIISDSIFCQPCRLFGAPNVDDAFTVRGFRLWKTIGDKCKRHNECNTHKSAEERMKLWHVHQKVGRIDQQLDPYYRDEKLLSEHKEHLLTILDIVLFCSQQEIALRGDNETEDSLNKGNFLELFKLLSKYDPRINERVGKLPKNVTMLSAEIQNDLLEASKQVLLTEIKQEVKKAKFYAILADEVKDASRKELLGVSFRYLQNGKIRERAIGFMELANMSAKTITEQLLLILQPFDLSPLDCVGQGYDGANVMSGTVGGVQSLMKKAGYSNAIYFHCASHRLNLVLASSAEIDISIKTFFNTLDLLYTFINGAKRHAAFVQMQLQKYPSSQPIELSHSCDTRWSSRSLEVDKILRRFDCVLDTLALFENDCDVDTSMSARSLLNYLQTKKVVILLVFFSKLYDYSDFCTKGLQLRTLNVATCIGLIDDLKCHLDNFDFDQIIEYGLTLAEKFEIVDFDNKTCSRKHHIPNKLSVALITTSLGHNYVHDTAGLYTLLRQIIGHIKCELTSRFDCDQYGILKAASACLPTSKKFLLEEELRNITALFGIVLPTHELNVFRSFATRQGCGSYESLMDVLDVVNEDIFPGIHKLYTILVTIPQTSCNVERLFSSVRRIKSKIRSRMTTDRLSSLALLSFEKDLTITLDRNAILNVFKNMKNRRLI